VRGRSSPRTDAMIAAAVQWAERIMRKIDGLHPQVMPLVTAPAHSWLASFRCSMYTREFVEDAMSEAATPEKSQAEIP